MNLDEWSQVEGHSLLCILGTTVRSRTARRLAFLVSLTTGTSSPYGECLACLSHGVRVLPSNVDSGSRTGLSVHLMDSPGLSSERS